MNIGEGWMKDFFQGFFDLLKKVSHDMPTAKEAGFCAGILLIALTIVGTIIGGIWFLTTPKSSSESLEKPQADKTVAWEKYTGNYADLFRIRTPDGWLIRYNGNITYVPDAQHQWVVEVR